MAAKVHAMLANGSGGLDWQALPLACAYYGASDDVAGLIQRLLIIKLHRPDREHQDT